MINQGALLHASKVLVLLSVFVHDWLQLRVLLCVSSLMSFSFHWLFPTPRPIRMGWGLLFALGHGVQIALIMRDKLSVKLSPEEEELYDDYFARPGFTPYQFKQLMKTAETRHYKRGEIIFEQDTPRSHYGVVTAGRISLLMDGEKYHEMTAHGGGWLMDMYYPAEGGYFAHWPRTFVACTDCTVVVWRRNDFEEFMRSNERIEAAAVKSQLDELWGKFFRLGRRLRNQQHATGEEHFRVLLQEFVAAHGKVTTAETMSVLHMCANSMHCRSDTRDELLELAGIRTYATAQADSADAAAATAAATATAGDGSASGGDVDAAGRQAGVPAKKKGWFFGYP